MTMQIRTSFVDSDRTYGARRVWHDPWEWGVACGLHRVERLMKSAALRARPKRRRQPHDWDNGSNTRLRQIFWTGEGWLYVAVVIDLYSRRAVGWSMKSQMTAQLVTDALLMAIWRRGSPQH